MDNYHPENLDFAGKLQPVDLGLRFAASTLQRPRFGRDNTVRHPSLAA
jgi:hypothetical protein